MKTKKQGIILSICDWKGICSGLFILFLVMLSWGVLILPIALSLDTFAFDVVDGVVLSVVGFIGMFVTLQMLRKLNDHKWYEDIRKNVSSRDQLLLAKLNR